LSAIINVILTGTIFDPRETRLKPFKSKFHALGCLLC
jgi:hypothetical protein